MKNVLVTGGAGFIGSNFVHYLLRTEPDVQIVNLDMLTYAGSLENLRELPDPSRHVFIEGNIVDKALVTQIFKKYNIDTVVHFAAESHVDRSILDPGVFIETNVVGTFVLLEAARKAWLVEKRVPKEGVRFHHVSTDEVFGELEQEDAPFEENTAYAPRSPYAASKASSDHFVRAYHSTYGLPISITNCSNNYGARQFPEKLIPLMILNAASGKRLPIYGDGMNVRDWLYVDDHCEAIRRVIKEGRVGETYCVGGDNQPSNLEVVKLICKIMDEVQPDTPFGLHESLIEYVQDRPGHDRRYDIKTDKIGGELGWEPSYSLERGLRRTIEWYLGNHAWVKAVTQGSDYQGWLERNYNQREVGHSQERKNKT